MTTNRTYTFTTRASDFENEGLRCSGLLYLPEGVKRTPCLIMGHGLAWMRDLLRVRLF
jgi:hypothetical protein